MPRLMSFWVVVSLVALDEVGLARRRALERALAEQVVHEGADVEADLRPQRLVVRLEHHPLEAAVEAFLEEERQAAHRDVLPLGGQLVGAVQRARAPRHVAVDGEGAQAVDRQRVERAVLRVGQPVVQPLHVHQAGLGAGRRLPDAARAVGAGIEAGDRPAGPDGAQPEVVERIGDLDAREVERGVAAAQRGVGVEPILDLGHVIDVVRRIHHEERPAPRAILRRRGDHGGRLEWPSARWRPRRPRCGGCTGC